MRINIFMQYAPTEPLTGEGLGRYAAKIFDGLIKQEVDVKIVCPYWMQANVEELLEDEGIAHQKKYVLYNKIGNPLFYIAYLSILKRPQLTLNRHEMNNSAKLHKAKIYYAKILKDFILQYCAGGIFNAILCFILLMTFILVITPIAVLGFVFAKTIKFASKILFEKTKIYMRDIGVKLFNGLYKYEIKSFTKFAKKQSCDIWYTPTAFWETFNEMPQPRIMCIPDLSPIQFAGGYIENTHNADVAKKAVDSIITTADRCDILVTYNHIAFAQSVSSTINVVTKKIYEIDHASMRLDREIAVMDCAVNSQEVAEFARACVKSAVYVHSLKNAYLSKFSLDGTDYIFFPTRNRPNKNIINLVKAVEHLVRVKRRSVKLVLTDTYINDAVLSEYINNNRLQFEILDLGRQAPQTVAALYRRASLAVSTSKFEGSLPFTVTEALSVDTPVLITRNEVSEAAIPLELQPDMCFDGNDFEDIAKRIEWALDNRASLLSRQKALLRPLLERDWETVAKDYLEVFHDILSNMDLENLQLRDKIRLKDSKVEKIKLRRQMSGAN